MNKTNKEINEVKAAVSSCKNENTAYDKMLKIVTVSINVSSGIYGAEFSKYINPFIHPGDPKEFIWVVSSRQTAMFMLYESGDFAVTAAAWEKPLRDIYDKFASIEAIWTHLETEKFLYYLVDTETDQVIPITHNIGKELLERNIIRYKRSRQM